MKSIFISFIFLLFPGLVAAEAAYITNQLKAGLHEDKSLESPIVKILVTGTRLEIVKREEQLSFVKDTSGTSGWINNQYLMAKAPNDTDLKTLQSRSDDLEKRLEEVKEKNRELETRLKSQGTLAPEDIQAYDSLKSANSELQQQYKAEKLKVGALQVELTELRNRLGLDSDTDALFGQIKNLQEDKKKLEIQLANILDSYNAEDAEGRQKAGIFAGAGAGFNPGARNMFIYLLITLALGLFAGAYLMDLLNRRRHGGFRV